MIARYITVLARIQGESEDLEKTVAVVSDYWTRAQALPEHYDAYISAVGLNLHAFYSGVERIFQTIAIEIDGSTPRGESWHLELLRQMTFDIPAVRPAVLSHETALALDEYRGFRHLIRNVYSTHLDPERIGRLVDGLAAVWEEIETDLTRFQAFLQDLARADEDET